MILETGRSICTAQGLAERFHRSRVFRESIHLIEGNAGGYARRALPLICWVSAFNSQGRESILLHFLKSISVVTCLSYISYYKSFCEMFVS